jgi:hypothetical protein
MKATVFIQAMVWAIEERESKDKSFEASTVIARIRLLL